MTKNSKRGAIADPIGLDLLEHEVIMLQPEEWDAFVRMLGEPAEPTPALKALMARKPPWEEPGEEPEGSR